MTLRRGNALHKRGKVEAMLVVCLVRVYCSLMSDVTKPPEDSPQLVVLTSEQ